MNVGSSKTKLVDLKKNGKRYVGKKEYIEILEGNHSTPRKRVLAMCYECMGWYTDGQDDCGNADCPLYGMMPYRKGKRVKESKDD